MAKWFHVSRDHYWLAWRCGGSEARSTGRHQVSGRVGGAPPDGGGLLARSGAGEAGRGRVPGHGKEKLWMERRNRDPPDR